MNLTNKQRQILAEFFSNMAIALITVGGISPLFDRQLSVTIMIQQFTISLIAGTILLMGSLSFVRK